MSILTEHLPCELVICGEKYPIKSDFRIWIKFSQFISSGKRDILELAGIMQNVFETLPPSLEETIAAMLLFCSPVKKRNKSEKGETTQKKIYDFDYDAELIYAAFMQQYRVDLCTQNLHWQQFKALFDNLTEETQFVKVMQYRSMDLSKVKDKEQKKFYRKMKQLYMLPDERTEEEKRADFERSFAGMFI